jgi:hypothetical protein
MVRKANREVIRQREAARQRVGWVLNHLFGGHQRRMGESIGVSQALISQVLSGRQGPGKQLLSAIASLPEVSAQWIVKGDGEPLLPRTKGTLPIAFGLLPGSPEQYGNLLTGQRYPVAEALDRASRYWLQVEAHSPVVQLVDLKILPGDLLLMETDSAWTMRLDVVQGRLCGVRLGLGRDVSYKLGIMSQNDGGYVFAASDAIARLDEAAFAHIPKSSGPLTEGARLSETSPVSRPLTEKEFHAQFRRKQRKITPLGETGADESAQHTTAQGRPEHAAFAMDDIVAVCIYLARPSPICV